MTGNKDESMWPYFILTGLIVALVIIDHHNRKDLKEWIRKQEEAEADHFLNQVKNHLSETRPFER